MCCLRTGLRVTHAVFEDKGRPWHNALPKYATASEASKKFLKHVVQFDLLKMKLRRKFERFHSVI